MHYVWRALLVLFLLYCELFSDRELFPDCELFSDHELFCDRELFSDHELFTDLKLRDTRTLAPPHVMHALRVASSACSFTNV